MHLQPATILVVGPSRAGRVFLSDNLGADGHDVLSAPTPQTAWQLLGAEIVDLAIVDLSDGGRTDRGFLELITQIRQSSRVGARVDPAMPVVVLSPRAGEVDRLRIFEFGSDDLIQHPYSYPELRARLRALLRRAQGDWAAARVRVGPLEVDTVARQVWLDARPVSLSGKEFALLAMLVTEPCRVFSRAQLLRQVWGFEGEARTRTVDVHASRLRHKLAHPRQGFVINVWGEGYKLVSAVSAEHRHPTDRHAAGRHATGGAGAAPALTLVDARRAA